METFVIILIILVCILLVLIILAQDSKGGAFAGFSGANQLMGAKRTTDLLEKLTWGFIAGIFVLTVATSFIIKNKYEGDAGGSSIMRQAKQEAEQMAAPEAPNLLDEVGEQNGTEFSGEDAPAKEEPAKEQEPVTTPAE